MAYRGFVAVLGVALLISHNSLTKVAVIEVPGPKGERFDYLTIDAEDHYLLSGHLGPGILYVVDMRTNRLVKAIPGLPGITGLEYVPGLHKVYTSNWGEEKIGVVDLRKMSVIKRLPTESKPNGMAYAEPFRKVYVVNTLGKAVTVIDVDKDEIVKVLRFDSETGTPGYDSIAKRIYAAFQQRSCGDRPLDGPRHWPISGRGLRVRSRHGRRLRAPSCVPALRPNAQPDGILPRWS